MVVRVVGRVNACMYMHQRLDTRQGGVRTYTVLHIQTYALSRVTGDNGTGVIGVATHG